MYQVDSATAATTFPEPAAVGPNPGGFFTNGNPGTVPATFVDQDIMNAIMLEIANAVTGAGLTLSKTNQTQLADAIAILAGKNAGHGQCRLSAPSATQLILKPLNGNKLIIQGVTQTIPSGGVTISNAGLAATTLYYIYAGMSGTTMVLNISTTGHTTGADGVEVDSADATQTLVGMVFTNGTGQFASGLTFQGVLNWFNRRTLACNAQGSNVGLTSSTPVNIATGLNCMFLTWSDEAVLTDVDGNASSSVANSSTSVQSFVDGATFGIDQTISFPATTLNFSANSTGFGILSEGMHTAEVFGNVSGGGTITWGQIQNIVQIQG
jgi:hypothetical protein